MNATFNARADQGELYFDRISAIPSTAVEATSKHIQNGDIVVGHSETGHHHVVRGVGVTYYEDQNDPMKAYLRISTDGLEGGGADLVHLRGHDTHTTLAFSPGMYEIRKHREYISEDELREVQD